MCFNQTFTLVFTIVGVLMSILTYRLAGRKPELLIELGLIHICYQPYFTHLMNYGVSSDKKRPQWKLVLKFCLVGGSQLLMSHFWAQITGVNSGNTTTEWMAGSELCTYSGKHHLAWSVPLYPAMYLNPGSAIHSFVMFVPFFVMSHRKSALWIQGLFLLLTGPVLAMAITPNLHEQASIWCFFSILQISVMMVFLMGAVLMRGDPQSKKKKVAHKE